MAIMIPQPVRRLAKWVGYPLFGFFVFLTTLFATLPRERIKERIESLAATATGAEVTIGDLGLTLFTGPGVTLTNVIVKTRAPTPSDKPARWVIDDATVHAGILDAVRGRADLSFDAHFAGGSLEGQLRANPDETMVKVDLAEILLQRLPGIAQALTLPVEGSLTVKGDVTAPMPHPAQALGRVDLSCDKCVIGDGKAKISVQGDPMLSQGITFPRLQLGTVKGAIVVEKGRATFKDVRAHSADVDLELDGYIELRDDLRASQLHLYLRFRPSPELVKREPTMDLLQNMLGTLARRSDGYIGFSITGALSMPLPIPSKDPPPGVVLGKAAPPIANVAPPPPRPSVPAPRPSAPAPHIAEVAPSAPAPTPEPSTPVAAPPPGPTAMPPTPAPMMLAPAARMGAMRAVMGEPGAAPAPAADDKEREPSEPPGADPHPPAAENVQ